MATLTPLTSFFSSLAMGQTEVHDPSKPIHVGRIRLLLLFPIVIMAIIVTTYALYTWLRPGRAAAAASRRRPRPAAFNQITSASSLLDTHGNTLTPWKGSRPHAPRMASTEKSSDPEGWFNLVLVLILSYVVTAAYYNRLNVGHWMQDQGAFLFDLSVYLQDLVRDVAILCSFYASFTFGFQRLVLSGLLPVCSTRSAQLGLQAFAEATFLLGSFAYAHGQKQWPLSQRAAFLMQVVVLTCKMHSYLAVNRQLAMEKAAGGPGTGVTLFVNPVVPSVHRARAGSTASSVSQPLVPPPPPPPSDGPAAPPAALPSPAEYAPSPWPTSDGRRLTRSRSPAASLPVAFPNPAPARRRRQSSRGAPTATGPSAVVAAASTAAASAAADHALAAADLGTVGVPSTSPLSDRLQQWGTALTDALRTDAGADAVSLRQLTSSSSVGGATGGLASSPIIAAAAAAAAADPLEPRPQLVAYPDNVTLKDFLLFSFAPTMCYEPNYPRTQSIRLGYVLEKLFLALGLMAAGMHIMTGSIVPVFSELPKLDPLDAVSRLLLPITLVFLLLFFVTYECILNAFAELTFFAARDFYSAFWNSTTFLEFSRHWNKPVHHFLLRHCYVDAMRQGLSPNAALYLTFGVSIIIHELLLWSAFGLTLPYLALFSLLQLPLGKLMQLGIFKGRRLGNLFFWFGLTFGITVVAVLYAYEYCGDRPGACSSTLPQ